MIPRRFLIAGVLALAGCATLQKGVVYPQIGPFPELEPVRLLRADQGKLVIEIASRGCSARPDLVFHVERKGGVATVAFARRRLQTCRDDMVNWIEVAFTRAELGLVAGEPVFLLNPLGETPGQ
jgi:hypothetical protein